jgi:hypothetical protein
MAKQQFKAEVQKPQRPVLPDGHVAIPAKIAAELRDFFGRQSSSNRFSVEAYEVLRDALNQYDH